MLDPKFIREHVDEVKRNILRRRVDLDVDELMNLDADRTELHQEIDVLRRERNEIAEKMKNTVVDERPTLVERGRALKQEVAVKEEALKTIEAAWQTLMLKVPNMTHPDSPDGLDDSQNKELKRGGGEVARPSFKPRSHVELAQLHDLIDFERGAKVAGAKFYFLKGKLAVLQQALAFWVMQQIVAKGYMPMITPDVANEASLVGAGFAPRGPETQIYSLENTDLSLIGTAEIPLNGYHQGEILEQAQLPLRYVGVSHCFRTEAGTYGRESYGLYRVHQFLKVEMVVFSTPEQSEAMHEEIRAIEEELMNLLRVPYRVVDICTGDLGGPAYRKYDLEAWMWGRGDGQGDWGEVTSCSNCTDYQARRLNIRYRAADGSVAHVHTLNGTGAALSRLPIAILENYQQENGSILVPEVLRPLCGFDRIG